MIKTQWNPATYLEFAGYRARAGEDLLARLVPGVPGALYDLGCGPGTLTRQLKDRWPEREVIGIDSSSEMLARAAQSFTGADIVWRQADIAAWRPDAPAALLFANAALHWVPDHGALFPRLMNALAPGGLLAVQMPATGEALYHVCIEKLLKKTPWQDRLAGVRSHSHPWAAKRYYDLISPQAATADIWETHYHHVLADTAAVTAWVSGTALVPYLTALDNDEKTAFLADFTDIAVAVYPASQDGKVLFTMRRLFIVAARAA